MKRWDELQPKAERAIASLEDRVEKLVNDADSLKRLPPDALEKVRRRIDAMREKLAEATAAYEQRNADLAVEKAKSCSLKDRIRRFPASMVDKAPKEIPEIA